MDCSTDALLQAARCFDCNIPPGAQGSVRSYLLCQWANKPTCDPDALNFIATAGVTVDFRQAGICQLVADLKNTGTPSFWSRLDVIYPFAGGATNLAANLYNLKDPNTNLLTQIGVGLVFNAGGVKGNSSAVLSSPYQIPVARQDKVSALVYTGLDASVNDTYYFGARSVTTSRFMCRRFSGANPMKIDVNTFAPVVASTGTTAIGFRAIGRPNGASQFGMTRNDATWVAAVNNATTNPPNVAMYLLGLNDGGVITNPSDCRISGWACGDWFDNTEIVQMKAIWDTYETALGRGNP